MNENNEKIFMFEDVIPNSQRWFDLKNLYNEKWKDIDIDNNYSVSNYGRIKSKKRIYKHWNGFCYANLTIKEKILKCSISEQGYFRVSIGFSKKRKVIKVHQLVARHFLDNPNNYNCINHIDCNKLNNKVNNHEYCTIEYNIKEAAKNGLLNKPIGYGNPANQKVAKIDLKTNEVLETYYSLKEAQEKTGIKYQNISACCRGVTKYAGNYKWIYIK